MNATYPRPVELLAPARTADIAIEAIRHGADAVYIGPPANGARAAAANSLDDIARAVKFAHQFNARVYATVNTIIYESELKSVEAMIRALYNIGVDAIIAQDLGILRMDIPPIALHASTQCDTRTPAKARFLEAAGFSQIVPARELTVSETADICAAVSVPVEVFVHGALCVSYSGDCYASFATTGRSANRGECAQLCRLTYSLYDASGACLIADRHLLSLKDLNRSAILADLLEAGVSSFKIEGRLKDVAYVKNVVAAYRRALDSIIDANPQRYSRSSSGNSICSFTPALHKSFNRGFTTYFSSGPDPKSGLASFNSPKWTGEKIGAVARSSATCIELDSAPAIANGDGLGYFDADGRFCGFRVNRAQGRTLFPAKPTLLKPGTAIFRNSDKAWTDMLAKPTAERTIPIDVTLRVTGQNIVIDITDSDSMTVSLSEPCAIAPANAPQQQRRSDIIHKTGDTIFTIASFTDLAGNNFIPASVLTKLRRDALAKLTRLRIATHKFVYRAPMDPGIASMMLSDSFTYEENIANSLARSFYTDAGARQLDPALETRSTPVAQGTRVMTTRYCLRRECGRCLRTPGGALWKGPLSIRSGNYSFRLDFDCRQCRMNIFR